MYNGLSLFKVASALAGHASTRQSTIARNIANADTPAYRARDLVAFSEVYETGRPRAALNTSRSGHMQSPLTARGADLIESEVAGEASPNGNTVSVESEMMKASEVRYQHNMALSVYRSAMTLMRTGLGSGR